MAADVQLRIGRPVFVNGVLTLTLTAEVSFPNADWLECVDSEGLRALYRELKAVPSTEEADWRITMLTHSRVADAVLAEIERRRDAGR